MNITFTINVDIGNETATKRTLADVLRLSIKSLSNDFSAGVNL